ncbi:MAG: 30S ribosomal protein S17 [Deltaproteobacteria bacterium]|jgi:small subunit ribosomal protein S17|nr:30S ribosomal protein S17 [Deltaproteobacteria bacterium]
MQEQETAQKERGLARKLRGYVRSDKMDKSVVVAVSTYKKHPQYGKYVLKTKKYMAHDETNQCRVGDQVEIVECRPLSKNKCWRVRSIVEKAI